MDEFAAQENNEHLFNALRKRHPFRAFREAVERAGLQQKWYDFMDEEYVRLAEEWLKDNDIDFVDGKVARVEWDDSDDSEDEH